MSIGGAPSVVYTQLQLLNKEHFEPHLLTLYRSKQANYLSRLDFLGENRIHQFALRNRSPFDVRTLFKIFLLLRKEKFDVVYTHLFLTNFLVRMLAVLVGVKRIVIFEHSRYDNKKRWQKIADRLLARYTGTIVVTNKEIADFIANDEQIPRDIFTVLPHPITPFATSEESCEELRREFQIKKDEFTILCYGRFSEEKGFDVLVRAAHGIREYIPNAHIYLVGHGAREEDLKHMIVEEGVSDVCHLLHEPHRARDFLCVADVFVLPSRREGQSISTGEAMAHGVPVVASRLPTIEELIEDDVSGVLFNPEDSEDLVKKVKMFAEDGGLRQRLATAAHERIASYQDTKLYVRELEQILMHS